jgi:uncharacterized protein (TIGR03083 family)
MLTVAQFVAQVRQARAQWDALVAQIPAEQMTRPGAAGDWSVKDVLAHIAWHENEMLGMLQARALVGSGLWNLPLDQRNQAIYAQNKDRSLQDVQKEYIQVFARLLPALEKLVDQDLHDPARFPGMPADWEPWQVIASNTYEHYQDHLSGLQTWLHAATSD